MDVCIGVGRSRGWGERIPRAYLTFLCLGFFNSQIREFYLTHRTIDHLIKIIYLKQLEAGEMAQLIKCLLPCKEENFSSFSVPT